MKVYLTGHPGNKHILPASSFLIEKYLNENFEVNFLNFGDYDSSQLIAANYIKLDEQQVGGASAWAKYLREYFKSLDDEYIVFSLDDFFLCREIDMKVYEVLFEKIKSDSNIACAKLGISPIDRSHEYDIIDTENAVEIFCLKPNASYSVSTQYCIWRRESLIDILEHVSDAWSFELSGTTHLNARGQKVIGSTTICLPYGESSAVSNRHPNKVSILGMNKDLIEEMISKKLLNESELIVGQPIGDVGSYSDYKNFICNALGVIEDKEFKNYCNLVLDLIENNKYVEQNY